MQISIGNQSNLRDFSTFEIRICHEVVEIASVITKQNYSLGTFKDGIRRKDNFIHAEAIGLDFDGGYPLSQAIEDFKSFQHIIAPTRSHQIDKNGKVEDRFRVILF